MSTIQAWLERVFHLTPDLEIKLLTTIAIIILMGLLRFMVVRLINQQMEQRHQQYHWRKAASYLITILGLFLIGRTWIGGIQSVATFLGLASAGLAIALSQPLTSFAAWLFIVSQRPFTVGDRIQIGNHSGDVIDIAPFKFTLLEIGGWVDADQSTGRILYVPNGEIFRQPLANYTTGFDYIWHEIQVIITFESDWFKAKQLLNDIAKSTVPDVRETARDHLHKASQRFMIYYNDLTPIVYVKVKSNGVALTLRYLCQPRRRRGIQNNLWEAILTAFKADPDIDFAYPTQRFYDRAREKPDPGVPPLESFSDNIKGGY